MPYKIGKLCSKGNITPQSMTKLRHTCKLRKHLKALLSKMKSAGIEHTYSANIIK